MSTLRRWVGNVGLVALPVILLLAVLDLARTIWRAGRGDWDYVAWWAATVGMWVLVGLLIGAALAVIQPRLRRCLQRVRSR